MHSGRLPPKRSAVHLLTRTAAGNAAPRQAVRGAHHANGQWLPSPPPPWRRIILFDFAGMRLLCVCLAQRAWGHDHSQCSQRLSADISGLLFEGRFVELWRAFQLTPEAWWAQVAPALLHSARRRGSQPHTIVDAYRRFAVARPHPDPAHSVARIGIRMDGHREVPHAGGEVHFLCGRGGR